MRAPRRDRRLAQQAPRRTATLTLTFADATSIKAGQAYLIKWDGGSNLGPSDLVFTGVNLAKDLCDDEITAD